LRLVSRQEHDARARFADRYREERIDVVQTIERAVIGGDWGANGYTTAAQADNIAEVLELGPSSLLLDVGAGRGWPGLYLAASTGCSVVLSDVPVEGLIVASARSRAEGMSARAWCVNASALDNPFRDATFDAVVHTDVLC
jgi:2-polyprenyl-3-methyl-5-hydroxy-6-metoxy-1,4-benzoquinol methylase